MFHKEGKCARGKQPGGEYPIYLLEKLTIALKSSVQNP